MQFDWTINVGTLIAAGGLLVVFIGAHVQNRTSIQEIQTKVDLLYKWFERRVILKGDE